MYKATFVLLIQIGCFVEACFAQEYPRWFLHQGDLKVSAFVIGYANTSGLSDSSKSYACMNAKANALLYHAVNISGGELFWSTEGGTYWLGTDVRERVLSDPKTCVPNLTLLESFETPRVSLALVGDSTRRIPLELKQALQCSSIAPTWIESVPIESNVVYAVGIAPDYYYESSSWQEAERIMRKNLARSFIVSIKMLGKKDLTEIQSLKKIEVNVDLKNIVIVERWRDNKNHIYYVLGKIEVKAH